jgi:hypothetical protein
MRYRFPRTAVHAFTETSNREMNVPAGFCVRQTLKVEVSPSYGGEVECPKETHEGVDKQRAVLRTQVAVMVTEVPVVHQNLPCISKTLVALPLLNINRMFNAVWMSA